MKITAVDAYPIRLARDSEQVTGTAGSPSSLAPSQFDYRWSQTFAALYSVNFETALVKVTTDEGLVGWGEAQAPLAPEVACTIVETLLRAVLVGEDFAGDPADVKHLWHSMYSTMRVRGQTGGFMLDAISGVDLALWDLAGKIACKPVAELIAPGSIRKRLPAYLSGLSGVDNQARVDQAENYWSEGFRTFKLFFDRTEDDLFDLIDRLQEGFGSEIRIAVDALWRLDESNAPAFGLKLVC